jgi:hypothetical protein
MIAAEASPYRPLDGQDCVGAHEFVVGKRCLTKLIALPAHAVPPREVADFDKKRSFSRPIERFRIASRGLRLSLTYNYEWR